jgi:hypothetical protein
LGYVSRFSPASFSCSGLQNAISCVLQFAQGTVSAKTCAINDKGDGLDQMVSVD